jgi:hypothetical protein
MAPRGDWLVEYKIVEYKIEVLPIPPSLLWRCAPTDQVRWLGMTAEREGETSQLGIADRFNSSDLKGRSSAQEWRSRLT